jgi:hypothetical protein
MKMHVLSGAGAREAADLFPMRIASRNGCPRVLHSPQALWSPWHPVTMSRPPHSGDDSLLRNGVREE